MGRFKDWLLGYGPPLESKDANIVGVSPELQEAIKWGEVDSSYAGMYRTQPSVYTVVEFLAWQISQVRIKVYERTGDNDRTYLGDSPLQQLLKRPAPRLSYQRWMQSLVADLCVFGNHYSEKVETGDQRALLPLPPFTVTPRGGNLYQASTYQVDLGPGATAGTARQVDAEQMFHPRRYNPVDLRIGLSPLDALRTVLKNEREALLANSDMWRNAARVPGYLERPADATPWTQEQRDAFRIDWQNAFAGRGNSGKTAVLEGITFKEASWSPKEAEFIEGRKQTLQMVCQAYNVPVSLLSLSDSATFASQKEFHRQLYVDTLGPWFRMIEAELMESIVPWFTTDDSVYVEFNVEEKLRGSFEEQAASNRQAAGVPYLSVNEVRAMYNLPRIDDPAFDLPVQPANINYAGMPGEAPMPDAPDQRGQADVIQMPMQTR